MFSDDSKKNPVPGGIAPNNIVAPQNTTDLGANEIAGIAGSVAQAAGGKVGKAVSSVAKVAQAASNVKVPGDGLMKNIVSPDLPSGSLPSLPGGNAALMKNFAGAGSPATAMNFASSGDNPLMKNVVGSSGGMPTLSSAGSALMGAMGTGPSGLQFTLTVDGLPPDTFVVVDFSLTESFSSPYILQAGLASADPAVSFEAVLDNNAALCVWRDGELQRRVTGIIAAFEQGDTGFHQTRYSMIIRPSLWRTSLRRNSRIFQQQTPEEIITTLLRESGVVNVAFSLRNSHPAREFCVQYQEDDFSFIQRISAEEGMYYYFETGEGGETLIFADDAGTLPAGPTLPWNPAKEAQSKELCVNAFRRSVQIRPATVELKDYTFKNPNWPGKFNEQARELHNQRPDYEYYDFPGRFKDEQHGKDFSLYHLDGLRNDADSGHGQSNAFQLYPGLLFTLTNHPRADLNTRWQVVSITHTGRQPQALEHESGEQGTVLYNQFSFVPAPQTWRPAPLPKPKMDGSQIGIVVGPPGEEIYCDNFGRVRVQFPWDRYGQSDDKSSCWIRVSQPWAGQGWGMIATPRIGQEVVVDFLHGDPDQPIIIGRTYHANNLPSIGLPTAKTQMAFRSKTHKGQGYNELKFEDANGQEMLSMHAQKDMSTTVLNNRTTVVLANHAESVTDNQSIQIGKNQSINVLANQGTQVKEKQNTLVGGDKIINVGGGILMASAKGLRLVCGEAVLEMNAETGNISLICNNFNIYAKDLGQITAGSLLDLNMDGAKPGTTTGPSVGDIKSAIASAFSGKGGK
ncbi:type VI secretion system secreted protein VgrG [Enterobacillus tribolii]|uniref:Type VI secretion system secreted protein VgrG n=2 Tax=Enterobacillus tribolii TaxID=1487935 RepID=A0A370QHA3_9GAMM|nr:type VI secretion system secreted protein VgrG [Enterobacillus tribolii]